MTQKCLKHGESIRVKGRYELRPGAQGVIETCSRIKIPEGYMGIMAIRQQYGDSGLSLTSELIWGGFDGHVKLYVKNTGVNPLYFTEMQSIAHLAIVKAFEGEIPDAE